MSIFFITTTFYLWLLVMLLPDKLRPIVKSILGESIENHTTTYFLFQYHLKVRFTLLVHLIAGNPESYLNILFLSC